MDGEVMKRRYCQTCQGVLDGTLHKEACGACKAEIDIYGCCSVDCLIPPMDSRVDLETIRQPPHYNQGIECWDYIVSHKMSYLEGNVIKYVTRYKSKNGREDLLKAQAYLEKLLKETK